MHLQVLKEILTDSLENAFSKEAEHVLFCFSQLKVGEGRAT